MSRQTLPFAVSVQLHAGSDATSHCAAPPGGDQQPPAAPAHQGRRDREPAHGAVVQAVCVPGELRER